MFDKLIALIQQFGMAISPIYVIDMWERGIVLRAGRLKKVVGPGIYFKMPFLDAVWRHTVITQSIDMPPQSITTADGKNVVVKGIIRFSISDILLFLTTITEPKDVLTDTTGGMIREIIESTDWMDLIEVDDVLTEEVGKFVEKWGIKVEKVTLTDLQIANTFRVIQDGSHQNKVIPANEQA